MTLMEMKMAKRPNPTVNQPTVTMSQEMFNKQYELIINLSSENANLRNYASMLEQQINEMAAPAEEVVNESDQTE